MVQEMNILRCYSCQMFQVHIVKKASKWQCKICNEKQSVQNVYYRGSGQDCRLQVQHLNLTEHTKKQEPSDSLDETKCDERKNISKDITKTSTITNSSKWTKYMVAYNKECHQNLEIGSTPNSRKQNLNANLTNILQNNNCEVVSLTKDNNCPNSTAGTSAPCKHITNDVRTELKKDKVHGLSSSSCDSSGSSNGNDDVEKKIKPGGTINKRPKFRDDCLSMKKCLRDIVERNRSNSEKRAENVVKKNLVAESSKSVLKKSDDTRDMNRCSDIAKPSMKRKTIFENDSDELDMVFDF